MKKLNSVYESSFSKFRISVQNSLGSKGRRESSVVEETRIRIRTRIYMDRDKEKCGKRLRLRLRMRKAG